ncbi:MAG: hypothetical protein JKY17_04795 [Magnetovibrio sp.]|nr:hypothetical protein [Magnetovibrio sp.]
MAHNKDVYKWRHLVENYFTKIKEFRGIATRYDKTDVSYSANWTLTVAILAAGSLSTGPRTPGRQSKEDVTVIHVGIQMKLGAPKVRRSLWY